MNLKYRKMIAKIKPLHKAARYVMYNGSYFTYLKLNKEHNFNRRVNELKNNRHNDRCFIIGNGPSLSSEDLDKLVGEDCFGANEIHRIFSQTKWRPKYYVIVDRYSKSTPEEIKNIPCKNLFLSDYYWKYNQVLRDDAICVHQSYNWDEKKYRVSSDITKKAMSSPTVSFISMQIAAYLGYKEIYLLGFDHNYAFEFAPDGSVIHTDQNDAHFFKDEIPEDIIADVWGMTKAYEAFREYAEQNGIVVKNATRGGKLEVFERIDFASLFT